MRSAQEAKGEKELTEEGHRLFYKNSNMHKPAGSQLVPKVGPSILICASEDD
jgi:hypothetical protein